VPLRAARASFTPTGVPATGFVPFGGDRYGRLVDITGDGKLDVLMQGPSAQGLSLQIFPGKGDGTFGPGLVYAGVTGSATADIDHDGRLDILAPGNTFDVWFARCVK
jgi:hypothetical protein